MATGAVKPNRSGQNQAYGNLASVLIDDDVLAADRPITVLTPRHLSNPGGSRFWRCVWRQKRHSYLDVLWQQGRSNPTDLAKIKHMNFRTQGRGGEAAVSTSA